MSGRTTTKLSNTILKAVFIVACIPTLLVFLISIFFQVNQFSNEKTYIENEILAKQKEDIKREVSRVIELIDYKQSLIRQGIEEKLIDRINQAHAIASTIYQENKSVKSDEEIRYLIVSALKNISYNEKRAYFYINDLQGNAALFIKINKLGSGANLWNLKDVKGNYVVRNHVKIALSPEGEGFVTNYFNKPDVDKSIEFPKLNYIKYFEPLNWYIGIGEYLDDIENQAKQEILKEIASIRFGKDGYIFVNSTDQKGLVYSGNLMETPKDFSNSSDFMKQLTAIQNDQDGYFQVNMKRLNTEQPFPKISYVDLYEKWGWIIGSGVYLNEIETENIRKADNLKATILKQLVMTTIFMLVLIVIIYYMSRRISAYIDLNVNQFIVSFKAASKDYQKMDTNDLTFTEFEMLATDLNKTLQSRNEAESKLKDYVELVNNNVIISTIDHNGKFIKISQATSDLTGYTESDLVGVSISDFVHDDMPSNVLKEMYDCLGSGKVWNGELKCIAKDGSAYWFDSTIYPTYHNGEIVEYNAILQDITDKKNVEYLSITDELTKLNNRRYFNIKFEEEINRAKRSNLSIHFMLLDIDYFKKYNDAYGHQNGDYALQKVAQVLLDNTKRASDFAFRLGGEEFGILFSGGDNSALDFANKIRREIEDLKIENEPSDVSKFVTVSIGMIRKTGKENSNSTEFFKETDDALYETKKTGRNRVTFHASDSEKHDPNKDSR